MTRLTLLVLPFAVCLFAVGCTPDGRDAPVTSEIAPDLDPSPAPPSIAGLAGLDTLTIRADATALDRRPRSPLRIEGACPFEGCQYGEWTTTVSSSVYAASGDTTSVAFTVPAETTVTADGGFVLITRVGRAVARRATVVYLGAEEHPVAAGDTLTVLDNQGEGFVRVWADGVLGSSDQVLPFGDADDGPFDLLDEPRAQWWAHVRLLDGRSGWLWMDRMPSVRGTDALG